MIFFVASLSHHLSHFFHLSTAACFAGAGYEGIAEGNVFLAVLLGLLGAPAGIPTHFTSLSSLTFSISPISSPLSQLFFLSLFHTHTHTHTLPLSPYLFLSPLSFPFLPKYIAVLSAVLGTLLGDRKSVV